MMASACSSWRCLSRREVATALSALAAARDAYIVAPWAAIWARLRLEEADNDAAFGSRALRLNRQTATAAARWLWGCVSEINRRGADPLALLLRHRAARRGDPKGAAERRLCRDHLAAAAQAVSVPMVAMGVGVAPRLA